MKTNATKMVSGGFAGGSWNLTHADLLFCTVPIVIFLSIVSLV